MCELLGLSSRSPINIQFSFSEFSKRGGVYNIHKDGWGLGLYDPTGYRLIVDDKPAASSQVATAVSKLPIKVTTAIGHIRRATVGVVSLCNTQPFMRLLWGRRWTFAHNGDLPGASAPLLRRFNQLGTTDSEVLFCTIMDRIASECGDSPCPPTRLIEIIEAAAEQFLDYGIANFLLSDGECLYVHCHSSLHFVVRKHPFCQATLRDQGINVDFSELNSATDEMVLIATRPLTVGEIWHKLPRKKVVGFAGGRQIA